MARDLKGLIGEATFLVAERIHAIIAAVGMHTPFLCLGSEMDIRVTNIVGKMLNCADAVYFLQRPSVPELLGRFDGVFRQRTELATRLATESAKIDHRLQQAAAIIRRHIG